MIASSIFHAVLIAGLANVRVAVDPRSKDARDLIARATILKIGQKLYYTPPVEQEPPRPKATPVRRRSKASPSPPAPEAAPGPPPAPQPRARAPRVFVPPEVKRNPVSDTTLIQPASPPDLVPEIRPLATFEVRTLQPVRLPPRRFIVPGQQTPREVEQTPARPLPNAPEIDVRAVPVDRDFTATLVLPAAPPPLVDPNATEPQTESHPGDPVDILAVGHETLAPGSEVLVPPGNAVGRTGQDNELVAGGPAGGIGPGRGTSPALGVPGGRGGGGDKPGGTGRGADGGKGAGSGAGAGNGPGRGGGSDSADSGGGAGAGIYTSGPVKPGETIHRPRSGVFDAVVVQNTPTDQFPEAKGLLSGRPIYSVYLSLGTAKDWVLYFCVPGSSPSQEGDPRVVQLGKVTPVEAPYPFTMQRPDVTIPSFFKYVLVHGFVNAEGHFEKLRVVRATRPDADRALLASLNTWEFRPATRDGVDIGVEFLLSIPVGGL